MEELQKPITFYFLTKREAGFHFVLPTVIPCTVAGSEKGLYKWWSSLLPGLFAVHCSAHCTLPERCCLLLIVGKMKVCLLFIWKLGGSSAPGKCYLRGQRTGKGRVKKGYNGEVWRLVTLIRSEVLTMGVTSELHNTLDDHPILALHA